MKKQNGFTLIEIVVYLGLFMILMGGGISAAYNLIESNSNNQAKFILYDEGNFLLNKINWVVSGSSAITIPPLGDTGEVLQVTKLDNSVIRLALSGTDLTIEYGNSQLQFQPPITLNNNTVKISNLKFNYQEQSPSKLAATSFDVTALTDTGRTISQTFVTSEYLRQ